MSNTVTINAEIDVDSVRASIEEASNLNDNEAVFKALSAFAEVKKQAQDILEQMDMIESEVKGVINAKASALYGPEWQAIKGHGYKVTKSQTGSVYVISGKPMKKFLKESLNTELVKTYIKEKGTLPKGVDFNASRGHSIRITVQDNG